MTPHRLTANEKVTELDTPIASAAILPSALLLGVLLVGPPRLALVPLGGGSAHVIDLHLDSPQEVALLSPDAALVRTEGGSVWALANLTGEPRPKAVASDIRSLHARPGGAHALGIGKDGSATAFSISRGEVSARTFTARGGALRAADVDEHVTYVIAEGEEGGVFRIHPGATPELGTSARAVLPREALELDRVRGTASLAVVFKRGEAKIAAVTGGPRRFDARLVHLGGKVADVAVIGASLAVVFVDGRAALYDEATIAGAGAEPLVPMSEITLGTRGRPKILLAATIKGAPVLCAGTSSGELLSLSIRPAEATAPEPIAESAIESLSIEAAPIAAPEVAIAEAEAEPEPAPSPTPDFTARITELEAELDTLRKALAEAFAAREKDRLAASEDLARALADSAEREARELAAIMRAEREEGELALSNCRRELDAARELALRALAQQHAAAFARVEQSHDQALAARDEAMAALKQRFEEEQQALSAELETTAKRLGVEIDRAVAVEAELAARTRHLVNEHAEVDGLRTEVERLREETARQKAEAEEQKAQIDKLEDAVSRERERAITAERAGEGVINVDRAREKLSGVLDRVMTEIQKRR
ncbi:MAG: hypothetical protein ACMG6S_03265 [Byssovorax sp.]